MAGARTVETIQQLPIGTVAGVVRTVARLGSSSPRTEVPAMGYLHYGSRDHAVPIEDRTLAHLKVVILSELREGRSIAYSFRRPPSEGSGRETLWLHPAAELRFQFLGNRAPSLNRDWLKAMWKTCQTPTGLYVMEEPEQRRTDAVPTETGSLVTA
jgi:hypothetical protein